MVINDEFLSSLSLDSLYDMLSQALKTLEHLQESDAGFFKIRDAREGIEAIQQAIEIKKSENHPSDKLAN